MRYFYRVLRKSKTNKFSFRRTFKFFAVSIRSRKSRQNNAFHSCPEAADVAFPWSEVIITHISLDVFFSYQKKCQVSWLYQTHWTDWTALTFELEKRNQVSPLEQKHPCFFVVFFYFKFHVCIQLLLVVVVSVVQSSSQFHTLFCKPQRFVGSTTNWITGGFYRKTRFISNKTQDKNLPQ